MQTSDLTRADLVRDLQWLLDKWPLMTRGHAPMRGAVMEHRKKVGRRIRARQGVFVSRRYVEAILRELKQESHDE